MKETLHFEDSVPERLGARKNIKKKTIAVMVFAAIFILFILLEASGYYLASRSKDAVDTDRSLDAKSLKALNAKNTVLKKRIFNMSPKGNYIVVDTGKNRLYVKKGEQVLKEVIVSTGSGSILNDPSGQRQWVFDTPRGELSVQSKIRNPVWTKPDWAFIEEGEEVPKNFNDRMEEGVLGDYGFALGNGYLIHGTLYTRLLGRNVTHGCIRVGDKDLKELYESIPLGTKVLIF